MAVQIIPYTPELLPAFQQLNRIWISRYFRIEPEDERELEQAEEVILGSGGQIFFALAEGVATAPENVLGCVGVFVREPDFYEIVKLAVRDDAQGLGLGRKLTQAALDFIHDAGASRAVILSNRGLAPAMRLYASMGFVEVELGYTHLFERCDIELVRPLVEPAGERS